MAIHGRNQNASGSDPACLLGSLYISVMLYANAMWLDYTSVWSCVPKTAVTNGSYADRYSHTIHPLCYGRPWTLRIEMGTLQCS